MKEFMLLFRQPSYDYSKETPKEMQALAKKMAGLGGGNRGAGKTGKQWKEKLSKPVV